MRVRDVAPDVLAPARVVHPDDRRAQQRGAAEREQVIGGVVEQHRDVARSGFGEPLVEQGREPARLLEVLAVGPLPVAELDRDIVRVLLGVAPQQCGRVGCNQRRLTRSRDRSGSQT